MINPPVEPTEYLRGVNVVDIGDLRVARGRTRRERSTCNHRNITYDTTERRVWCQDCEQEIEAFDAFERLVRQHDTAWGEIERRSAEVAEAEKFTIRRLATKALDKVWRGKMIPVCKACGEGMLPEDYTNIGTKVSREYALAQRRRRLAVEGKS